MKKMFKGAFYILAAVLGLPTFASAQNAPNTGTIDFFVAKIFEYARMGITFLMIAATLYFIYTVIKFMQSDDKGRGEAKSKMIAGIIGLTVIVCVWGIVFFISRTLGISGGSSGPNALPCPPGTRPIGPAGSCI